MLFSFGLVAVALLHGMAAVVAVPEAFFFAPATGAGRTDTGSRNTRGRILLYRVDGRVLAGLGVSEGSSHVQADFVLIQQGELRAIREEGLRRQCLERCSGTLEFLGHQMALLPDAPPLVPAPEAPVVVGVDHLVGEFSTNNIHLLKPPKCVILRGDGGSNHHPFAGSPVFQHQRAFCLLVMWLTLAQGS